MGHLFRAAPHGGHIGGYSLAPFSMTFTPVNVYPCVFMERAHRSVRFTLHFAEKHGSSNIYEGFP